MWSDTIKQCAPAPHVSYCLWLNGAQAYAVERIAALYLVLQPLTAPMIARAVEHPTSQDLLVQQILSNPHVILYPPALDYQRRAWKSIVTALEETEMVSELRQLICARSYPVHFLGSPRGNI